MRYDTQWTSVTIRAVRDLTAGIREFTLVPEQGATTYPTGSHLAVRVLIDGRADLRHYSLVGELPVDGAWRIAVKREEPGRGGSRYMWSLPTGARLEVSHPDSHFQLSRDAPEYLLIAGGIGITPIRGMATRLLRQGAAFRMLYAGRARDQMAYLAELEAELGDRLETFAADQGRHIDFASGFAALGAKAEAYVCGPIGMLDAARRAWTETGRPPSSLVYETFGSSGRFAPEAFTVRVPRLGKEIRVAADDTMLDALEREGVEVLWDCRRGECGLCVVDVLETEGAIDHRDVFFSAEQHEEGRKMCVCVSRMAGGSVTIDPAYRGDAAG